MFAKVTKVKEFLPSDLEILQFHKILDYFNDT